MRQKRATDRGRKLRFHLKSDFQRDDAGAIRAATSQFRRLHTVTVNSRPDFFPTAFAGPICRLVNYRRHFATSLAEIGVGNLSALCRSSRPASARVD